MTFHLHNSNEFNQEQLRLLEQKAGEKLQSLIELFNLDLKRCHRFYCGPCPIHGGDKKNAFNLFHEGINTVGNWRCFTNGCHKIFHPTLLGFIRGYLSKTKYGWSYNNKSVNICPFHESVDFLQKFTGTKNLNDIKIDYELIEKNRFVSQINQIYSRQEPTVNLQIKREDVIKNLDIPAEYFLNRGFSKEVLTKYDVGLCKDPNKEMYMRCVVPIFDSNHEYIIGCTGRSIFKECPLCQAYHNPLHQCPKEEYAYKYAKWKHNYGFKAEQHLYNYWYAKESIKKTGIAIVVESPGNVWKLDELNIPMGVGTYGAHFTADQKHILDQSGALALIILTDPDRAGEWAKGEIIKQCQNSYQIYTPKLNGHDVAETNPSLIKNTLYPLIEQIKKGFQI